MLDSFMRHSTIIITTLGRPSLKSAISSALREDFPVIVVADGPDASTNPVSHPDVSYVTLGRHWGLYGSMGWNVGAALARTEYVTHLGDDDELSEGYGVALSNVIGNSPNIDIWIPSLHFNHGPICCAKEGLYFGNVAAPTYRTKLFMKTPYTRTVEDRRSDFEHVAACVKNGALINWCPNVKYLVRPKLPLGAGFGNP